MMESICQVILADPVYQTGPTHAWSHPPAVNLVITQGINLLMASWAGPYSKARGSIDPGIRSPKFLLHGLDQVSWSADVDAFAALESLRVDD
jgi:hypothetical protein